MGYVSMQATFLRQQVKSLVQIYITRYSNFLSSQHSPKFVRRLLKNQFFFLQDFPQRLEQLYTR